MFFFSQKSKVLSKTFEEKIKDNELSSVVSEIIKDRGVVNRNVDGFMPIVNAVLYNRFQILLILLDNDANPLLSDKDKSLNGEPIMDYCFSSDRLPFLELMISHDRFGQKVLDYLKDKYIDNKLPHRQLADNIFKQLSGLISAFNGYHFSPEGGKIKILEDRIALKKRLHESLVIKNKVDFANNVSCLINYFELLKEKLSEEIQSRKTKELSSNDVIVGDLVGSEFTLHAGNNPCTLRQRRIPSDVPSTSSSSQAVRSGQEKNDNDSEDSRYRV
jgi:hypothetical protein